MREDFLDAPIGHRIGDKHRSGRNFVLPLLLSPHRRWHLSDRDPLRRFDATLNHSSSRTRLQVPCGVIGLLGPLILNEPDAAPVDYLVTATCADDDERGPPRMSFHSERDLHGSSLTLRPFCAQR